MAADRRAYEEIIDLFARGTSSAEVLAFRPSVESQDRVRYLLARNKSGELTQDEADELERFGELERLMELVKARAPSIRRRSFVSLTYVPADLRRQVRERSEGRCEYCLLAEEDAFFTHEADHVVAEKHGGETVIENLALSCFACNRFKGSDIASIDPTTGELVHLFQSAHRRLERPLQVEWRGDHRPHGRRPGHRAVGLSASKHAQRSPSQAAIQRVW